MIPTITKNCQQYLKESNQLPLIKYLPIQRDGVKKVKIRKKDVETETLLLFNESFPSYKNILNRCIFVNNSIVKDSEPFYIFPIDGYKILYNENITNTIEYFSNLVKLLNNSQLKDIKTIIKQQINELYFNTNISNAMNKNCEIIIYGIPYYYAVRASIVNDYKEFIYS